MTPFLYIVRHGQTDANAEHRLLGRLDIPLNTQGLAHAARIGRYLQPRGITCIYSSPLQRARQTADIVAAMTGAPLTIDERLIEMDFGDLDGMRIDEAIRTGIYAQRNRDRMGFLAPNGESYRHVAARVAKFMADVVPETMHNIPLPVGEGGVRGLSRPKTQAPHLPVPGGRPSSPTGRGKFPIAIVAHQGVNRMMAAALGLSTQEEAASMTIGHETLLIASRDSTHKITAHIEDISHEGV